MPAFRLRTKVWMKLTTQQKADVFYARMQAVIDFANEVDADRWREHVLEMHSATWPWRKKPIDGNVSASAADHVQPVSHG